MRSFLARCTMLGLLVAGFALTGDAGWLIRKGRSLLDATTVPAVADVWGDQPAAPPPDPETAADLPPPIEPSARPPAAYGPVDVEVAPSLASPVEPPPAGGGAAAVDLRLLRPGTRLRLWVNGSLVAFDIVDPGTGEAIQQPVTRRVHISGGREPGRIERGHMIVVQPRAGISGHQPRAETLGPVQAIDL